MFIYLFLIFISAIFTIANRKRQVYISVALMAFMMLMCGLRGEYVGTDTTNYMGYVYGSYLGRSFGFVYEFLRFISLSIGGNPSIFLMLMAILTYVPLALLIAKESKAPVLSVLLYMVATGLFFLETFNIARQSIAIVYVAWAAFFLVRKNYIWSLVFFAISFCFHPYVFPFAIMYGLCRVDAKELLVRGALIISFIIGLIGVLDQINEMLELMYVLTEGSESVLVEHLGKYSDWDSTANFSLIGKMSHMMPITLLCWFTYDKRHSTDDIYYKMMLVGAVVTNLFVSVQFCERIASTFTLAQILAVPSALEYLGRTRREWVMLLLVAITALYIYNLRSMGMANNIYRDYPVPYKTCFEKNR